MADELKKISEYDQAALSDELMFLVEQADGTYAYVLGSDFSGGGSVDIGVGSANFFPLIDTTGGGGEILTLKNSPASFINNTLMTTWNASAQPADFFVWLKGGSGGADSALLDIYINDTGTGQGSVFLQTSNDTATYINEAGATRNSARIRSWHFTEAGAIESSVTALDSGDVQITATGGIQIASLAYTGNKAVFLDASLFLTESITTATELSYLNGLTGFVQTQFDAIATTYLPLTGGTLVGNLNGVTPTELGYVSGATSNFQNQINNINAGVSQKLSVRAATTANITLSGAQTIDGVSVIAGDRVLVKNQSTGSQNGIYVCASGAWTRATDATTGGKGSTGVLGMTVQVEEGGTNADQMWACFTDAPITIGTTALVFGKTSNTTYTASSGIVLTGNNFTLDNTYFSGAFTLSGGVATLSLVGADKGGTGVANNAASTWTISGNFGTTMTVTGTTALTLPTTGTLATLAGSEAFTNKTYNGNTWTAGSGTLTLAASSSLITSGAFATTFVASATATLTLPTATSTLLANNLGLSVGTTLVGGTTATGSIIFQDTSNSTNSLNTNHFIWKMTTAAGALEESLRMGNATGGEMNLYSMGNTTHYWLRSGINFSYFNANTDLRLQIAETNAVVINSSSISLRLATTMFTAMNFTVCAGTTTVAPFSFQSGTLKTTASQFAAEVSSEGQLFYSPAASQRNFIAMWGYVAKTANYTATVTDYTIDCTANTFTVTLPTAGASVTGVPAGRCYVVVNSGTGTITVATTSSQTINGSTTFTINTQYSGAIFQSNGTNWIIVSQW